MNRLAQIWQTSLWKERSERERALLVILAVVTVALVAWYGIAVPLSQAAEDARSHHARAAAELASVEAAVAAFSRGGDIRNAAPAAVEAIIHSAEMSGVMLERHCIDNAREITVWSAATEPAALFAWIAVLQRDYSVVVSNMTITRNGGGVATEIVLARGGM